MTTDELRQSQVFAATPPPSLVWLRRGAAVCSINFQLSQGKQKKESSLIHIHTIDLTKTVYVI